MDGSIHCAGVSRIQDAREPTQRQHEEAMARGSKALIAALWAQHHPIMRSLTGREGL